MRRKRSAESILRDTIAPTCPGGCRVYPITLLSTEAVEQGALWPVIGTIGNENNTDQPCAVTTPTHHGHICIKCKRCGGTVKYYKK